MSDGYGCTCAEMNESECACDADWTPQELIDIRAENGELRRLIKDVAIPALSCCTNKDKLYAMIPESMSLTTYKNQLKIKLALVTLQEAVK